MPLTMRPTELSSAHWKSGNPTISHLPSRRAFKDRAEARYVCADPLVNNNRVRIVSLAQDARLANSWRARARRCARSDVRPTKPSRSFYVIE
jgi:hypothetical protein